MIISFLFFTQTLAFTMLALASIGWVKMLTLPLVAALIGWFTNYLAVKMLFHPKEKTKFLFFEFQGIFPKRQKLLAAKLGSLVSKELVSFDDIKTKLNHPDNLKSVYELIDQRFDEFLEEKFPESYPMLAMFVGDNIKAQFKKQGIKEIEEILPQAIDGFIDNAEKNLDIQKIVFKKVSEFSSDKLERIVFGILEEEFKFIELVGAALGFFIGIVQIIIMSI